MNSATSVSKNLAHGLIVDDEYHLGIGRGTTFCVKVLSDRAIILAHLLWEIAQYRYTSESPGCNESGMLESAVYGCKAAYSAVALRGGYPALINCRNTASKKFSPVMWQPYYPPLNHSMNPPCN